MKISEKNLERILFFLIILLVPGFIAAQSAEVTRSGDTWTSVVGNDVVYTGNNMTEAVNAACNGMTGGTINVRDSGFADVFWGMQPRANQTIDFHENTIESADNVISIYGDRRNGITIRNLRMTGSPRYGIWFRGCSDIHLHNITMELSHSSVVGLGIRVDNHSDHNVGTENLTVTGVIRIEGTRGHGFETYSIDGVEIERIYTRNTGGCGVILNDTRNADIGYIDAYRADYGGGYAGFRTPNGSGPNVVVDTLIATECGRGFFSLTGSSGVTVNYVEITGCTNIGIWIEDVPDNRVLSGYVWGNNNSWSISGDNSQGSSINVQSTAPSVQSFAIIQANPPALNFGAVAVSSSQTMALTFTAQNLYPWDGTIALSAPGGYEISLSETSGFSSDLLVPYSQSSLVSTTVYVRFSPTAVQDYTGSVAITGGNALAANISLNGTGEIAPVTEINKGSGNFIGDLTVYDLSNGENWDIVSNNAAEHIAYGDRDYTISSIPQILESAEWISSAMDSRTDISLDRYASFTAIHEGTVFVAHSDRIDEKPEWMSAYDSTEMYITVAESDEVQRRLVLYSKRVSAGENIDLGINASDGSAYSLMYLVFVIDESTNFVQDQRNRSGTVTQLSKVDIRTDDNTVFVSVPADFTDRNKLIKMYDMFGRRISLTGTVRLKNRLNIPVSHLTPGFYLFEIGGVRSLVILKK